MRAGVNGTQAYEPGDGRAKDDVLETGPECEP